jgi:putative ABC transport system ATP-binding protein
VPLTKVLHGLTFNIDKGEFVAIMGPSGSGKSTLMHILGFLDKLTSGSYIFGGKNVSDLNDDQLAGMRGNEVSFIFQAFNLLPRTTVIENVMLPLTYLKMTETERRNRAKEALVSVGLGHRLDYFSNQLSGGERQRVAIARSIIGKPALLLADEPTGNLDNNTAREIMSLFMEINEIRKKIDKLDEKIVALLNDRAQMSLAIGKEKAKNNKKHIFNIFISRSLRLFDSRKFINRRLDFLTVALCCHLVNISRIGH